jgi:hypothetical protein
MDLDYCSASDLVEFRPGRGGNNYARGAFTARRPRVFAFATLTRPHPSQQAEPLTRRATSYGGPHHLEVFSPPHSEGYIISKAHPHILLVDLFFSWVIFYSVFAISTQSHSWERTGSVCIIHLYSVFARPPTLFLPHLVLAYSSLFSHICTPMCYLFGGLLVSCYIFSSSRTIGLTLTSLPDATKIGSIDL